MDLSQIVSGIAKQMRIDRELILAQIPHSGEMGGQLEESLRDFLSKYLPNKYEIGTGHIIAPEEYIGDGKYYQGHSRQVDVVVFNKLESAPLLNAPGYQIYPQKGVDVAVEVKATLDSDSLKEAVNNIKSVKQLRWLDESNKDYNIIGVIFAYNTSYTGTAENLSVMHNVVYRIHKCLNDEDIYTEFQAVDMVCVLDTGCAIRLAKMWYVYSIEELEPLLCLWHWLHLALRTGLEDYLNLKIEKYLWNPLEGELQFRN